MTQPAKVQEPSMEEILASIRRIIADDEAKPADLAVAAGVGATTLADAHPRLHNVAAVGPQPVPASTGASRNREEIDSMLAGIEKIITEPAHGEADVFDLTDEMAMPNVAPAFRKVEPKDDVEFADPPQALSQRESAPQPAAKPAAQNHGPNPADILSHSTATSVESAFNSLAATVLSNNSRTLEDIVREMMRPMLKTWLDDNLPSLVERIVKTEIERVARGR